MKKTIAKQLLQINAVTLSPNDPFTWSSGIKSPIYCDNRLTLSYPDIRTNIAKTFKAVVKKKFPNVDVVAGTATAGIAHAALLAELLEVPMCYVRSEAKGHGKGNQIEGRVTEGQNVIVVEDLISTGGSVITVVKALQDAGCNVVGAVSIFTYELDVARKNFAEVNIPIFSLTDFTTLINIANETGEITNDDVSNLLKWRKNPSEWEG